MEIHPWCHANIPRRMMSPERGETGPGNGGICDRAVAPAPAIGAGCATLRLTKSDRKAVRTGGSESEFARIPGILKHSAVCGVGCSTMKTKLILTTILTLGLCAGAATAKNAGKKGAGQGGKYDTDGDGKISLAEFSSKSKKPDKAKKRFAKADANNDGQIDKTELSSLKEKRGKKGGGKKNKGNN